jgi:hypothetical protein
MTLQMCRGGYLSLRVSNVGDGVNEVKYVCNVNYEPE